MAKKLKNSTSSDSDSGLSGTNGESGSDRESEQVGGLVSIENLNIENILPDDVPELLKPNFNENFENLRPKISNSLKKISNRKVPFMGLALRTNPDLSEIAKNETKIKYECYECGNLMAKRQPLVKTNGILFMKNREEQILEHGFQYDSVTDCAFTRSEIVKGWNLELREHQGHCFDEMELNAHYQRKYNEKYNLGRKSRKSNHSFSSQVSETSQVSENSISSHPSENSSQDTEKIDSVEKLSKFSKFLSKINKSTSGRSRSRDVSRPTEPSDRPENCFEPPPSAARKTKKLSSPSVKIRPHEISPAVNFSGKIALASTVLREHCENCVLRDKPEEFQSVLFVCQL